jgi:hypothetical protein
MNKTTAQLRRFAYEKFPIRAYNITNAHKIGGILYLRCVYKSEGDNEIVLVRYFRCGRPRRP